MGLPDLERLGARLAVVEAEAGWEDGATAILAAVTDSPAGVRALAGLRSTRRLAGLVCDPGRLGRALGCGPDAPAVVHAAAVTVLAAADCGVPALLAVPEDDETARRLARAHGFGGFYVRPGSAA